VRMQTLLPSPSKPQPQTTGVDLFLCAENSPPECRELVTEYIPLTPLREPSKSVLAPRRVMLLHRHVVRRNILTGDGVIHLVDKVIDARAVRKTPKDAGAVNESVLAEDAGVSDADEELTSLWRFAGADTDESEQYNSLGAYAAAREMLVLHAPVFPPMPPPRTPEGGRIVGQHPQPPMVIHPYFHNKSESEPQGGPRVLLDPTASDQSTQPPSPPRADSASPSPPSSGLGGGTQPFGAANDDAARQEQNESAKGKKQRKTGWGIGEILGLCVGIVAIVLLLVCCGCWWLECCRVIRRNIGLRRGAEYEEISQDDVRYGARPYLSENTQYQGSLQRPPDL
jgi:hypothetical protein